MNIQELATIAHYKLPIKIIVLNNGGYALIKQTQDTWLNSRRVGVDKSSGSAMPNLQNISRAYEIETCELGHEHKNEVESNWGMYGHDECESEGKSVIQHLEKELQTN
jgi:acetolactate synthase-1/2/3 large subunit